MMSKQTAESRSWKEQVLDLCAEMRRLADRVEILLTSEKQEAEILPECLTLGDLRVGTQINEAWVKDQSIHLTPIEWKILRVLCINAPRCVTYTQIARHMWGINADFYVEDAETVKAHVFKIRRKIAPLSLIENVMGCGYRIRSEQSGQPQGDRT